MKLKFRKSKRTNELIEKIKLNRAQQMSLAFIGVTSIILGAGVVLVIWFFKYIDFNSKIITELDNSISTYSATIKNSGACVAPKAKDGVYSINELKACEPDSVSVESVPGTLKYNVLLGMSDNVSLDSVARQSASICENSEGKTYTQAELLKYYQSAKTSDERKDWFETMIMCSSLRTIPDALPTTLNENTAIISLNKIYTESGYAPSGYSPSGTASRSDINGLYAIPLTISIAQSAGEDGVALRVLNNIEKSVRTFSMSSAKVSWGEGGSIVIKAPASVYYTGVTNIVESTRKITPKTNVKSTKKGK